MLIFGLHSTSDDHPSILSKESQTKCEKKAPQVIKNEFLNYVQCLMISRAILAKKVDQNVKKAPKSSKNEMLIFGLCSTFDDWQHNLESQKLTKMQKRPPKSSKN